MVMTADFWERKCAELNQDNKQATKYYTLWLVKSLFWLIALTGGTLLTVFPLQKFCVEGFNLATVDYLTKFIQNSLSDISYLYTAYEQWFLRLIQFTDNKFWFIPIIPFIIFGYILYYGLKSNPYQKQFQTRKVRYYLNSNDLGNTSF